MFCKADDCNAQVAEMNSNAPLMTANAAYALFREGEVGSLAPGKYAYLEEEIMKAISRWGGLLAAFGGLLWAVLFLMDAKPGFDLLNQLRHQPALGLVLVLAIANQATGFYSLSETSKNFSIPQFSAAVCGLGALGQSIALALSIFVWGAAWLLGILGEMVITIALGAFAISSLSTRLPLTLKLIPFLMVPFYFVGWSVDPDSSLVAGLDLVNLSAAFYGLLWIPLGYAVWDHLQRLNRQGPEFMIEA